MPEPGFLYFTDSICILCCRVQHVFDEDTISGGGVVHQLMCHRADEFTILDNGTAAHALDNAAGFLQKFRICHPDQEIPAVRPVLRIDFENFHRIFPNAVAVNRGTDGGGSGLDF